MFGSQNQSSCQPRLGPDAGKTHPGGTVGESRMFQGEGAPSRTSLASSHGFQPSGAFAAPQQAPYNRAPHGSASRPAPRASSRQALHAMPAFSAAPQPSTSGWVPPGPPPPRSRHDSSGSESEASESESVSASRDTASARLADLIYEVCPASRPLFDAKAPRYEFEAWFGQPEASAFRQLFRMYPRVAEVLEEVAARSESLARRSRPLSRVIPARARAYAMADDAIFTSSQPVNSAFSQLVGSRSLGARRCGSITFSEMERLERLFQGQLEVTSSSLWLMSGILAVLKRDGFQPSDPSLFNSGTTGLGNLVLSRRDSLLADVRSTVPAEEVARLRYSPLPETVSIFPSPLLDSALTTMRAAANDALVHRTFHTPRIPQKPAADGGSVGSSSTGSAQASSSGASRPAQKQSSTSSASGQSSKKGKNRKGKAPFSSSSGGSGRSRGKGVVVACLLHTQEVPGSIPGRGSYLRQVSLH